MHLVIVGAHSFNLIIGFNVTLQVPHIIKTLQGLMFAVS